MATFICKALSRVKHFLLLACRAEQCPCPYVKIWKDPLSSYVLFFSHALFTLLLFCFLDDSCFVDFQESLDGGVCCFCCRSRRKHKPTRDAEKTEKVKYAATEEETSLLVANNEAEHATGPSEDDISSSNNVTFGDDIAEVDGSQGEKGDGGDQVKMPRTSTPMSASGKPLTTPDITVSTIGSAQVTGTHSVAPQNVGSHSASGEARETIDGGQISSLGDTRQPEANKAKKSDHMSEVSWRSDWK